MNAINAHTWLEASFVSYCTNHGYSRLNSVEISSKIDNTVYLVNSATNLFKCHFGEQNVSIFAYQKSMRTQILTNYYQEDSETEYPSFFESYGIYVSLDRLEKLMRDAVDFFQSIGFERKNMRVRASADDTQLIEAARRIDLLSSVVLDDRSYKYDHVYGNDLTGRAIKLDYYQTWAKKHKNLCYFILIYERGVPIGAEMATSDQLILMRLNELQYAIAASKISHLLPLRSFDERRFADSIVGMSHLMYEGIKPNSSNTNGRTLKKYITASMTFGEKLGCSPQQIIAVIDEYTLLEYGNHCNKELISGYLQHSPKW